MIEGSLTCTSTFSADHWIGRDRKTLGRYKNNDAYAWHLVYQPTPDQNVSTQADQNKEAPCSVGSSSTVTESIVVQAYVGLSCMYVVIHGQEARTAEGSRIPETGDSPNSAWILFGEAEPVSIGKGVGGDV